MPHSEGFIDHGDGATMMLFEMVFCNAPEEKRNGQGSGEMWGKLLGETSGSTIE